MSKNVLGRKKIENITIGGGDDYSGLESTHTTKLRNKIKETGKMQSNEQKQQTTSKMY